jgi:hypothetical protein
MPPPGNRRDFSFIKTAKNKNLDMMYKVTHIYAGFRLIGDEPMSEPSSQLLESMAKGLILDDSYLEEIEEKLSVGEIRTVRIWLLGTVDAKVNEKRITEERARQYYESLGFTAEEMSAFRQYAAMREYSQRISKGN